MSDHDVERLLGELRPEELPTGADAQILATIRNAEADTATTLHLKPISVVRRPVPAWAAAAACIAVSAASWGIGARNVRPSDTSRTVERMEMTEVKPPIQRVHVDSNAFVASPARNLDISKWAPVSGVKSESNL